MKRILAVAALCASLAVTAGTTAFAAHHHAKWHHVTAALAAGGSCADPSHCGGAACPFKSSSASATAMKAMATSNGAACTNPASCPASCPRTASTTAVAAGVTKH
jgi:hypothetical protein